MENRRSWALEGSELSSLRSVWRAFNEQVQAVWGAILLYCMVLYGMAWESTGYLPQKSTGLVPVLCNSAMPMDPVVVVIADRYFH